MGRRFAARECRQALAVISLQSVGSERARRLHGHAQPESDEVARLCEHKRDRRAIMSADRGKPKQLADDRGSAGVAPRHTRDGFGFASFSGFL